MFDRSNPKLNSCPVLLNNNKWKSVTVFWCFLIPPSYSHSSAVMDMASIDYIDAAGVNWILVEEGKLKGITLMVDRTSGETVSLSTRYCRDEDRFDSVPDLTTFTSLEVLDLNKSRYITEFDASVCRAPGLQRLLLTRCDKLRAISSSLGSLTNLTEVSKQSVLGTHLNIL